MRLVQDVVIGALKSAGLPREDVGFTCSGSCDYLSGGTFTFVANLDAVGAWPPIHESHVEMDGAWALYEAWVRLHHGDIDTALVFGSGKSSTGDLNEVMPLQNDPYYLATLGADPITLAALQARAVLDAGDATERDFAEAAARSRKAAESNPYAQVKGSEEAAQLLAADYVRSPLRASDLPPDLRRRGGGRPRDRAEGRAARGRRRFPARLDHRHRSPDRAALPRRPGALEVTRPPRRRPKSRVSATARSRSPSSPRSSPTRRASSPARSASAPTPTSTRPAARSRRTRSWRPAWSASPRRPSRSVRTGAPASLPMPPAGRCCSRT